MRSSVVLFLTAAACALPASALGAPVIAGPIPVASTAQRPADDTTPTLLNLASGRAALIAYANYLQALVRTAPVAQQDTAAYAAVTSSECKGALVPLTDPSYEVNATVQANLALIGQEIGDDLSITFDGAALTPFTKLSIALSRLHWTKGSGAALTIRRFLADQGAVITATPSNLCQDVVLVAASPQKLPLAAKAFIKQYTRASAAADASLTDFLSLLHTYETGAEHTLVSRIASLATQIDKLSQAVILANATALSADLKSN